MLAEAAACGACGFVDIVKNPTEEILPDPNQPLSSPLKPQTSMEGSKIVLLVSLLREYTLRLRE